MTQELQESDALYLEETFPCEFGGSRVKGKGHPSSLGLVVIKDASLYFADLGIAYSLKNIYGSINLWSFEQIRVGEKKLRRLLFEPVLLEGFTVDQVESCFDDNTQGETTDIPKICMDPNKFKRADYCDIRQLKLRKSRFLPGDIRAIDFQHSAYGKVSFFPGAFTVYGFRLDVGVARFIYEYIEGRL